MPPHSTPVGVKSPRATPTHIIAVWVCVLTAFGACDSNPTPHPHQHDTTHEVYPHDREPSGPKGDALGTETDTDPGSDDFTNCDTQNNTTDTDAGPNDFDRTDNDPCYPCAGESDGLSNGPPTGPR